MLFFAGNVDACEDEMKRLVAVQKQGKKRDTSFHDDRPRKAAMKYKESLKNPVSRKKSAKLAVISVPLNQFLCS